MLKGAFRPVTAPDSSDTSDSDSDDGNTLVISLERYTAANIGGGLLRRCTLAYSPGDYL